MGFTLKIKNFFKNKKNQKYILLYFLILSIVMFWPLRHMLYLYRGQDLKFHVSRIEELYRNLKDGGFFVYLSTYTANKVGIATQVFYPNLFIYLFAGLKFIFHNPIRAIGVGVWIVNLATLLSSYFSFKLFSKSNLKAFLFANIFGLSTYRYTDVLWRFDLGEYIALMFIPPLLAAFYRIVYKNEVKYWPLLAISMAGLLYSHIMTVTILCVFLVVVFICSLPKIKPLKPVLLHLVYAGIAFTFLALGFLTSFIKFYTGGSIRKPKIPFTFMDSAYVPSQFFNATLNNQLIRPFNLGIVSVVIIILALINYKKLSRFYKNIFILSLIFMVMATKLFPWSLVPNEITTLMQFPYRFLMLAAVLLAAVGAECLAEFTSKRTIAGLIPIMLLISLASVYHFIDAGNRRVDLTTEQINVFVHPQKMSPEKYKKTPTRYDIHTYYKDLVGTGTRYGYNDYAPWQLKVDEQDDIDNFDENIKHLCKVDGRRHAMQEDDSIPNGLIMKVKLDKANKNVSLPFYIYQHKDYRLLVNGKKTNVRSDLYYNLKVSLRKGKNTILVQYIPDPIQIVAVVISWLSLLCLLIFVIWQRKHETH